ncbi:MAG: DUF2284 domain-containing protein [Candidatus Odinarchaeota archaeon]
MENREDLEKIFRKNGYEDFKWIDPRKIVVSSWVRMKCMYGCLGYGKAACPPHTLSVSECEKFFSEYKEAVIFRFEKKLEKPDDRFEWSEETNRKLLDLEKEVFLSGKVKTFLLFMDSCELCKECSNERSTCKHPKLSRPTPEGMGVDVFSTVKQVGYPIKVLKDFTEKMNRYAFLMID